MVVQRARTGDRRVRALSDVPTLVRHTTVTPGDSAGVPALSPSVRSTVCENVRLACIWHGVDRRTLASMWGISVPTVSGIWRGTRNVSADELWTVAHAFSIPVERFFTDHTTDTFFWIYDRNEVNHG